MGNFHPDVTILNSEQEIYVWKVDIYFHDDMSRSLSFKRLHAKFTDGHKDGRRTHDGDIILRRITAKLKTTTNNSFPRREPV